MYPSTTYKNPPSVIGVLFIAIGIIFVIAYSAISVNTGDMLWFWPRNDNQPSAIVVHCYSEDISVPASSPHYVQITTLVNDALSGQRRWDPLSLSEVTYEEYMTHPNMMTLEVSYPDPVRIHSNTAFYSNVDVLLIPLDARHASKNVVFGRTQAGHPAAGSLFIESTATVREYLNTQGICQTEADSWWGANSEPSDSPTNNADATQN